MDKMFEWLGLGFVLLLMAWVLYVMIRDTGSDYTPATGRSGSGKRKSKRDMPDTSASFDEAVEWADAETRKRSGTGVGVSVGSSAGYDGGSSSGSSSFSSGSCSGDSGGGGGCM